LSKMQAFAKKKRNPTPLFTAKNEQLLLW